MKVRAALLNNVASIELADVQKKNVFDESMYEELNSALIQARDNDQVKAVLIYGQPEFFSLGGDLEGLTKVNLSEQDTPLRQLMNTLLEYNKPIIAAVNGAAIGAACSILLHCDFVYAADTAHFVFSYTSLGMVPDFATSYLLPRKVGQISANEMLLLAQPFNAQDALEKGFVNQVLPEGEVVNYARNIAERFNKLAPKAVVSTKKLMRSHHLEGMRQAMDLELKTMSEHISGAEVKEVIQAFLEQRWPDFSKF